MGNVHSPEFITKEMFEKDGSKELSLSADQIAIDTLATARIPSLSANKITSDTLALARIPTIKNIQSGIEASIPGSGQVTGDLYVATDTKKLWMYDGSDWQDCKPAAVAASVADFQANAATGTFTYSPSAINDNNTGNVAKGAVVGQYAEVDYGKRVIISSYRIWGDPDNTGDGEASLQYWDGSAWQDIATGILTRALASWSDMVYFATSVETEKVRLLMTVLDAEGGNSYREIEVVGTTA